MLSACDKLTRFVTFWGPKSIDVFTEKEKVIIQAQLKVRDKRNAKHLRNS